MVGLRVAVLLFLVATAPAFGCDETTPCDKCDKTSEYSWNPASSAPRLHRFYALEDLIEADYAAGKDLEAQGLISEYLDLAKVYRCNWNYGNAIHNGNQVRGLILLRAGDLDGATAALLEAGKATGSPQL